MNEGRGQEAEGRRRSDGVSDPNTNVDTVRIAKRVLLYPVGYGQTEQRVLLVTLYTYSSLLPSARMPSAFPG